MGSGVRPAPRAGAGPTVIAAGLVVLVIGLGWLNHSGEGGRGNTAFERDVSQAVERAEALGEIPGSDPASPSSVGGAGGDRNGPTTSTTIVIDPQTGIQITVNLPPAGTSGSSSTTGSTGGTTGTTSGPGGTTGTTASGGTGTTAPPSTNPPSTNPPTTDPPTTITVPTTPTTPTTIPDTTLPAEPGLLDGLLGILGL
jgi:hypothetical protein